MSDPSNGPGDGRQDWREMRRDERHERRRERREMGWGPGGAWIGGVILIGLGLLFLLQNFGVPIPHNWWAFFLLLPAAGALTTAWNLYRREGGRVTAGVAAAGAGGLLLAALGISFLLGFDWSVLWPVILIAVGIGVLTSSLRRR